MNQDQPMDGVLSTIFTCACGCVDIAIDDAVWLAALPPSARQAAVETHLGQLAGLGFIRRGSGHVSVTALGWSYVHSHRYGARAAA